MHNVSLILLGFVWPWNVSDSDNNFVQPRLLSEIICARKCVDGQQQQKREEENECGHQSSVFTKR